MHSYRLLILSWLLFLTVGCAGGASGLRVGKVSHWGSLAEIFGEGKIESRVSVQPMLPDKSLYAIGAMERLRGEITIDGGRAYMSYPGARNGAYLESATNTKEGATLLIATRVSRWRSVELSEETPFDQLDRAIAELAKGLGMDLSEPFVFRIEGDFSDLMWHTIDGRLLVGKPPYSMEQKKDAKIMVEAKKANAVLIGFYSEKHQRIFTHHDRYTHVHCIVEYPFASGHVDNVTLPKGAIVQFAVE